MLTALLLPLIQGVISALFPSAPGWVGQLLAELVPALIELTDEAEDIPGKGPARMKWVVQQARAMADEAFDDIPEWSGLSEARRDRIIGGVGELVLFAHAVAPGKRRRVLRRMKRAK